MRAFIVILLVVTLWSCDWAKGKAKDTVNKTGEIVAKTGSEFVNGVEKGVQKTFSNDIQLSNDLVNKGVKTGRVNIHGTDSTTDNIITIYLIFDNDFNQTITAKVYDEQHLEYGRTSQLVAAKKGEAKYFDFIFDKRTNIDSKGKILFE